MSELWNIGGLDADDTDSVHPTSENHGPHRMNRKQTANAGKNAFVRRFLPFATNAATFREPWILCCSH